MNRNTDGTCLVGDGASNCLTNPPCGVSRELVAAAVFEFVHRFHQTDIAFLNQIKELQAAVGVFFCNGNNQTQVGLNHFLFGCWGFFFAQHHVFVDFFQFFDGNAGFGFHICQLGLFFEDGVAETIQCVCPYTAFGYFFFYPFQIGNGGQEVFDEVVAFHADAVDADIADFAFEFTDVFNTTAQVAAQVFNLTCGETDFQQFVGNGIAVFQVVGVLAAVFFQLLDHFAVFALDKGEVFQNFLFQFGQMGGGYGFRVAAGVVFIFFVGIFIITNGFAFFVIRFGIFQMTQAQFVQQDFIRVDDGFNHFIHTDFVVADLFDQSQNFGNRAWAGGDCLHHVFQCIFDFFGDNDFVFTRQQIDLTHFTHIHTHRVGCAAEFWICTGECCFGFFNGIVVGHGGGVVAQEDVFSIGSLLGYLDTQAGNHADDVVDLLGVGHIVGQRVVNFGISDVAAFFTHNNELTQAGALLFDTQGTVVILVLVFFVVLVFRHGLLSRLIGCRRFTVMWPYLKAEQSFLLWNQISL